MANKHSFQNLYTICL